MTILMGYKRIILSIYLVTLSIGILSAQPPAGGGAQGQFDINSSTTIYDENGKELDFNTFIRLNPGSDYSDLHPNFDSEGKLASISITMIQKAPPPPPPQNKKVNEPPRYSSSTSPSTVTTPVTSKPNRKFRFTTAKELEGLLAPYYDEKDVNGKTYSSTTMAGKVVVLKFWFLKCAPCLEEIPELNRLVQKFKNNPNVKFIAAATDKLEDVQAFMKKKNFRYKILYDTYDIHGNFKVAGYPTHMVIYKSGYVAKVLTGKNTQTFEILEETIRRGAAMLSDDLSLEPYFGTIRFTPDSIIRTENGKKLGEVEYTKLMNTGQYRPYQRVKVNGREEILLIKVH